MVYLIQRRSPIQVLTGRQPAVRKQHRQTTRQRRSDDKQATVVGGKAGRSLEHGQQRLLTSKARHRRSLSRRRHLYRSGTLSHRELTTGHCKACRQEVRLVMSDDGSDGFMQWTKCHRHTADDKPDLEERMMAMGEVQAYNSGSWTVRELQRFAFVWVVSFVFVLWQLL